MVKDRLNRLRALMAQHGMDAYIIADADPHSGEYPADHWKARSFISGFTGSNGTLVVTRDEAALWTDGRYYIQAENQLAGAGITLMRASEPDTPDYASWIAGKLAAAPVSGGEGKTATLGVDGRLFSCAAYDGLDKALEGIGAEIKIEHDLVAQIWTDNRPAIPDGPVFCHDLRYCGKSASEKLAEVRADLRRRGAAHALICGLEDVAWLYNIRGSDVHNLPVVYAYAFVSRDTAELFIDPAKIPPEVIENLAGQGVSVSDAVGLAAKLEGLKPGDRICCDPNKLNRWLRRRIPDSVRVIYSDEPTLLLKAIKCEAELKSHRECQIWDGAAMARFIKWIKEAVGAGARINEWDASLALSRLRARFGENRGDSFNTIAGYGPNGAMMHYTPGPDKNAEIKNAGMMVVDSGGHYLGGTTDITRTLVFGETTPEERRDFTLTLKSHIALASARFLYGAAGSHIDSIARKVMWDHGLDYKCGTGHGIGCYLSVHEGPQSISMRTASGVRLEENMIVSIEPGVYREGKHGVRTENLARIAEDYTNEFGRFMRFEILSYAPIDLDGIEPELLDGAERDWLNNYHRSVYEKISGVLDGEEREWLARATRAI